MAVRYVAISAFSTVLSFIGLQFWTESSLDVLKSDGLITENFIHSGNASRVIELLLGSYATIGLLTNFVLNVFVLLVLCLKTIFFVELYPSETRKLLERLINYIIYKGTFLPLVVPPTIYHAGLWSLWMTVLCSLKMFQALARDRLERLNASPSATPWAYFRVYSVLLLVFSADYFWIRLCLVIYRTLGSYMFLLLFFEPFSVAFETMQAILVHGFQLLDIWLHHSAGSSANCQSKGYKGNCTPCASPPSLVEICEFASFVDGDALKWNCVTAAGSLSEWKGVLIRNLGFSLDIATLLMALGHYVHIWWLHGMAFHLVDAVLFLNIRALLSAIWKRIKGFIKLRKALGALHAALPDATTEELQAYDDECAICREPMAKAKKLHCRHLFHLACLRSWLDQGLNETYSCPTCRKPLFIGRPENEVNPHTGEVVSDEQLARQISAELDRQNSSGQTLPTGVFPTQSQNPIEGDRWRSAGLDSSWLHAWPSQGVDGAGPSNAVRSVGLGRVQMMMRHFASVGETYAHTAVEDGAWSLWPVNPSQPASTGPPIAPAGGGRYTGSGGGLRMRTAPRPANDNVANILTMAETVREVLPHMPDDIIFQDLQRTNSVAVTVNNLLQM
ncbi:E3 ubiquitin protein ligase RIN2 [Morella rubra]|uniref:RING-type E3 ubiquitin transferase n=1 Tax=Morella rubra TaxID=262757 RepID=A0A6A1VDL5_9ROSI|nr:E3 ubiquitin protein ligase RIN2 [Morella rubra]KAB1210864.1 E3 ubiquitin protein ligase RIN2 [Morella rubra]